MYRSYILAKKSQSTHHLMCCLIFFSKRVCDVRPNKVQHSVIRILRSPYVAQALAQRQSRVREQELNVYPILSPKKLLAKNITQKPNKLLMNSLFIHFFSQRNKF